MRTNTACPSPRRLESGHVFACRACQAEIRLAAAWRRIPRPSSLENAEPASDDFLRRITTSLWEDRRRRLKRRALLSAAAALLFFFLAGTGQESRSAETVRAEESYARLVAPSALESLLPE
jgi:hypothetical protein